MIVSEIRFFLVSWVLKLKAYIILELLAESVFSMKPVFNFFFIKVLRTNINKNLNN